MKKTPAVTAVAVAAVLIVGGLAYHLGTLNQSTSPASVGESPGAPAPHAASSSPASGATEPHRPAQTVIYTVSSDGGGDANGLSPRLISLPHAESPARGAIEALIDSDNSPLPTGTRLLGIKIADGLATLDFSRELQSNFHGSDTEEAQAINSVLGTMGQFPSVERVQIFVEGKPIDALSQLDISGPLDVIRPNPVRQAEGDGRG